MDFKIRAPCSLVFSGPSGYGKTSLVEELVSRLDEVFDRPPLCVTLCYNNEQPAYERLKNQCPIPIEFIKGLSSVVPQPRTLLILDDLQEESKLIEQFFVRHTHHSDLVTVYITQNLFLKTPHHRTCNLNSHVLCIFKNPRDKLQISCLAKQIFPQNGGFLLSAYNSATERPHGYLCLVLQQATPDVCRVRDSLFPKDAHFFVDKKPYTETDIHTL